MAHYCSVCGRKIGFSDSYKTTKSTNEIVCMYCDGLLLDFKNRMCATNNPEEIQAIKDEAAAFIRESSPNLQNPDPLFQLLEEKYQDRMSFIHAVPASTSNNPAAHRNPAYTPVAGASHNQAESSFAVRFFTVIAWILWIGGLIISIAGAITTESSYYGSETKFSFLVFITSAFSYFIYGCIAYCAAELFKQLQTIVSLLKKKQ